MAYWYRITPQGQISIHHKHPSLKQLQNAVGGDIEYVPMVNLPLDMVVLCNEQPLESRTVNFIGQFITSIPVKGTIVIAGRPDDEGELTAVPVRYDCFLRGLASVVAELREVHRAGLTVAQ